MVFACVDISSNLKTAAGAAVFIDEYLLLTGVVHSFVPYDIEAYTNDDIYRQAREARCESLAPRSCREIKR